MVLSKMTKEELELLKVDIQNELDTRTKEDKFKDGFDSHKIITSEECPDTKTRLIHNRKALPFDVNARHAMIKTRKKRLSEIDRQDIECLRRMMGKRYK